MTRWIVAGSIVVLALMGSLQPTEAAGEEAGKAVYTKKCATCHGETGEGKAAIAKMMKIEFRPLGSKDVQSRNDAELTKIIVEGINKMKPVKGLSAQEVTQIVAFVRTLAQK